MSLKSTARDIDSPAAFAERASMLMKKRFLQAIYREWAERLAAGTTPGLTLEIGGGSNPVTASIFANLGSLRLDLVQLPGVQIQGDALSLPIRTQSVANVVGIDVLHHFQSAAKFFSETARILQIGGQIRLVEPWNNRWSRFVYQTFHPEPFDTKGSWELPDGGPMSVANGALPWIVLARDRAKFEEYFPDLQVLSITPLMPLCFPLSGGSSHRFSAPSFMYQAVRRMERFLESHQIGLSALIIIQKAQIDELSLNQRHFSASIQRDPARERMSGTPSSS